MELGKYVDSIQSTINSAKDSVLDSIGGPVNSLIWDSAYDSVTNLVWYEVWNAFCNLTSTKKHG